MCSVPGPQFASPYPPETASAAPVRGIFAVYPFKEVAGSQWPVYCREGLFVPREELFALSLRALKLLLGFVLPSIHFVIPSEARNLLFAGSAPHAGCRTPNAGRQSCHLHRSQSRLKPLIPHLQPSAINSLLQVLASKHAKSM